MFSHIERAAQAERDWANTIRRTMQAWSQRVSFEPVVLPGCNLPLTGLPICRYENRPAKNSEVPRFSNISPVSKPNSVIGTNGTCILLGLFGTIPVCSFPFSATDPQRVVDQKSGQLEALLRRPHSPFDSRFNQGLVVKKIVTSNSWNILTAKECKEDVCRPTRPYNKNV